jgi:hemoglobin
LRRSGEELLTCSPALYSKTDDGQSHMIDLHARNGIGGDWSHRFVACFMQAAADVGFPDDQEFRAALRSYMEWATSEVESYAPADAKVEMNMPMPRWGWKGPE